jgi:hypothetical protein
MAYDSNVFCGPARDARYLRTSLRDPARHGFGTCCKHQRGTQDRVRRQCEPSRSPHVILPRGLGSGGPGTQVGHPAAVILDPQ